MAKIFIVFLRSQNKTNMKEKKAFAALKLLDVFELNAFRKFITSPYFNQKESIVNYFDYLNEVIKSNQSIDLLDDQVIWKIVFNDAPYENVKLRKLNADLFDNIELFLAQKQYENSKQLLQLHKVKAFKSKNATDFHITLEEESKVILKTISDRNAEYYLMQYQIEKTLFEFISDDEMSRLGAFDEFNKSIQNISDNLDIFFISEKLKYYSMILSWNQLYKSNLNMKGIDIILKLADSSNFLNVPVITIYRKIILIRIKQEETTHYYDLKLLIKGNLYLFPKQEAKIIIDETINYCIQKINQNIGDLIWENELLDIYKESLERETILTDGNLDLDDFHNIGFLALRVGQFKWMEDFTKSFSLKLKESERENALNFSLARLETFRKNFDKVIYYVNRISFDDIWYSTTCRSLLMTAYYELNEIEALESLLSSYRAIISREKSLNKDRKKNHLDLISFTKKLLNLDPGDKVKLKKLKEKIIETPKVINKPWLLEKIADLERKSK